MDRTQNLRPWAKGVSGNPGGRPKRKPVTEALEAFVATPEGVQALVSLSKAVVKVAHRHPSMAVFVRETLEGKLTERLEVSGGLELAARVARARQRVTELAESSELDRAQDE
jgi:hypothetical protein